MQPEQSKLTDEQIKIQFAREEKRKWRENNAKQYKLNNFGRRYQDASLCKLEGNPNELNKIHEWMKKPKHMLIYHGTAGIGKTYLCAALTDWAFSKFNTVKYIREEDLLRNLRVGISEGHGDYLNSLKYQIDDNELVILDDVGSGINPEKSSYRDLEFRREVFFSFLDNRYNSMLPTIITSNFSKEEFEKVYSKRITSRLFASENLSVEVLDGVDKRSQGY